MDSYGEIAAFYDCEHDGFNDDIAFYLRIIDAGPVLEVGVGTGRVMAPLLKAGLEVWGIDPSRAMLERARDRIGPDPNAHFFEGEVHDFETSQEFGAVILPLNTLWHADHLEAQLALLRDIRRYVHDDGVVIIDVSNPHTVAERGANGELRERFQSQCNGETLTVLSSSWDDEAEQQLSLRLTYDVYGTDRVLRRTQSELSLRYVYRGELELLLRLSGYLPEAFYGSYDMDAYDTRSRNILAVARPD